MIVGNMNGKKMSPYLKDEQIETREYQVQIAEKCVNKNSLVVLPTGLGKTIIAVIVVAHTLELYPPNSKVIMLAPTRPLINQHYNTFVKFLNIPEGKFSILTGKVLPDKRTKLFHENQIFFYTPQTLRNDLVKGRYSLKDTCLVIIDEVHHASGDYPYTMIADEYVDQNPDGNILALTASPGASKKKILELCELIHVPFENTHFRTRKDTDVIGYLKPMDIYKIAVELTDLMKDAYSVLKHVIEERLQYLSQLGFLDARSNTMFAKVIRKDLLKLNSELLGIIKGGGDKTGAYSALSVNAQALILYHMVELVEQQGLDNLLTYFENKIYKEALKKNSSKAVRILASDQRLHNIYLQLKKNYDYTPKNLIHPKYQILENLLNDEIDHKPDSRILVFVKFRVSVSNIVKKLKKNKLINAVRFVGQASKSKEDKGLSQKKQIEILDKFKEGIYNVLVSTNVGEEGLDIAECDMVVFYDVVASEIRLIQRKGRTARHREGKVVILYTKDTNDEIYLRIALNKLKKMNISLKKRTDLKEHYSHSMSVKERNLGLEQPYEAKKRSLMDNSETNSQDKSKIRKNSQANLESFINDVDQKRAIKVLECESNIKLSNLVPMSLGIRKRFTEDNIRFNIVNSDLHISLFNKILVQIYDPSKFNEAFGKEFLEFTYQLKEKYKLIVNIFDFTDYSESFEGEKRLLKRKLKDFMVEHNIQIVPIDNSEELYFIVKSIYEHNKKVED